MNMNEYWLFTITYGNHTHNVFYDFFPTKQDLLRISKGENYGILNIKQLTEEQYKKLTDGLIQEPPSSDEAQGTPAIKKCREHKFEKGDWINGYYTNYKVTAINSEGYVVEDTDGNKLNILFENEKFHHLFTIADAKEGDVLATDDWVFIFKKLNARGKPVCYCHYDDELGFKVDVNSYLATGSEIYPATIERRNILMKAMADAGYEWDSEKKELKLLITNGGDFFESENYNQKPAWSIKDEAGLGDALWAIQQARTIAKDETDMGNLWYAENWLNSLKERLQKS